MARGARIVLVAAVSLAACGGGDPDVRIRPIGGGTAATPDPAGTANPDATATATVPMAVDLTRSGGRILLAGLKHFAEIPGLVTDHIVLKSLQLHGGAGFTPQSMADAVALIESGAVRTDIVAGEVFDLDGIDEAMALLTRRDPGRDAVRVGLRHAHGVG